MNSGYLHMHICRMSQSVKTEAETQSLLKSLTSDVNCSFNLLILVGTEGKKMRGRPRSWGDYIEIDLKKIGWVDAD